MNWLIYSMGQYILDLSPLPTNLLISPPKLTHLVVFEILYPNPSWLPSYHLKFEGGCQYIGQSNLAHWAQPSILCLCTYNILRLLILHTYLAYIRLSIVQCRRHMIYINIQTIPSFSPSLYILNNFVNSSITIRP